MKTKVQIQKKKKIDSTNGQVTGWQLEEHNQNFYFSGTS